MYKDMFGKTRAKIGLHTHTNISDGRVSPEESAKLYKEKGYDAIAFTDHWKYGKPQIIDGLYILPGAEYDIATPELKIYHIVCVCSDKEPVGLTRESTPEQIIEAIHSCSGLAILAHPAWSLNAPDDIMAIDGFDATEIYNSISDLGMSFRPDSSLIIDMLGYRGRFYPLLATDDTHHYGEKDLGYSFIMAECDPSDLASIKSAIKEQRFYASQGPEIHLSRNGDTFRVDCSPVSKIAFASNQPWCRRVFTGEGITSAEYTPLETERFIRAFVVDENGKYAWSNAVPLK